MIEQSDGKVQTRRNLLWCGAVSAPLYIASDIIAALRWPGYSYTAQTISELMAIEAPTRPLLIVLFGAYDLLVIAFGAGVWQSSGGRALRALGGVLSAYGVVGLIGLLFTPVHVRGMPMGTTGALHIAVTIVIVLLLLTAIGLGAATGGKWFRVYSWVTAGIAFVAGLMAGEFGRGMAANAPTPGLGIVERVNVYACVVWIAVLAVSLLRGQLTQQRGQEDSGAPTAG